MMRHVYLGWDEREIRAYDVAALSLRRTSSRPQHLVVTPLRLDVLRHSGYLWRVNGGLDDLHNDDYPPSTEFSRSRFLIPFLQDRGWALYADCDVVALGDIEQLFQIGRLNPSYAVMCVKHEHDVLPGEETKMDGRQQRRYARKNWSSVMLWNCEHPAHRRLKLNMVNEWPRRLLHRFSWLDDDEIGELPAEWNWLVGVQPKPDVVKLAHFTLGGPWLSGWQSHTHDEIWLQAGGVPCKAAA